MGSSSSWAQQVLVHGAHQDANGNPINKAAFCTIANEDLLVNLVSKEFLENQLGFSKSSFLELKGTEKRETVGIAQYSRISEGAINLTWYHREGTRVFRDMRFLIVSQPHADIVIGAQSAQKYGILTEQDLKVVKVAKKQGVISTGNNMKDEEREKLKRAFNLRNEELYKIRTRQAEAQVFKKPQEEVERLKREYEECKAKWDVDEMKFDICDAERKNASKKLLEKMKEDLDELVIDAKAAAEGFDTAVDSET